MSKYAQSKSVAAGLSAGHSLSGTIVMAVCWLAPEGERSWLMLASLLLLVMAAAWYLLRCAFAWAEREEARTR